MKYNRAFSHPPAPVIAMARRVSRDGIFSLSAARVVSGETAFFRSTGCRARRIGVVRVERYVINRNSAVDRPAKRYNNKIMTKTHCVRRLVYPYTQSSLYNTESRYFCGIFLADQIRARRPENRITALFRCIPRRRRKIIPI